MLYNRFYGSPHFSNSSVNRHYTPGLWAASVGDDPAHPGEWIRQGRSQGGVAGPRGAGGELRPEESGGRDEEEGVGQPGWGVDAEFGEKLYFTTFLL